MTIVGKILVFFNLLLSVVMCALIVMVYSTRTSWQTEYKKVADLAKVAEAAYKAERQQRQDEVQARDNEIENLNTQLATKDTQLAQIRADSKNLQNQLEMAQSSQSKESTNVTLLNAEMERIRQERDRLQNQQENLRAEIVALTQDVNKQKGIAVEEEVARKSAEERNERLLERVEQMVKENNLLKTRLTNFAGGQTTVPTSVLTSAPPAVPRDVNLKVTRVEGNLVQISGGTDMGIQAGAELDLYRLMPDNPGASKYLGKLTVVTADTKQAVGRFTASLRDVQPRPGDDVGNALTPAGQ